jgi:hypothetical protein
VKLTIHLHIVPRSRKRVIIPPLPQSAFVMWCSVKAQEQLYLYLKTNVKKVTCDGAVNMVMSLRGPQKEGNFLVRSIITKLLTKTLA